MTSPRERRAPQATQVIVSALEDTMRSRENAPVTLDEVRHRFGDSTVPPPSVRPFVLGTPAALRWGAVASAGVLTAAVLVAVLTLNRAPAPGPHDSLHPTSTQVAPLLWTAREPAPRTSPSLAYDPALGEVVMFGGDPLRTGKSLDTTWALGSAGWHRLHPSASPPGLAQAAMAWDPQLRELVLFGGCTFCGAPGYRLSLQTWAFDGSRWTQMHSRVTPPYYPDPVLDWDVATQRFELLAPPPGYGPNPPNGYFDFDTGVRLGRWALTSTGWKWEGDRSGPPMQVDPAVFLPVPGQQAMLYFGDQPWVGTCPAPPKHEKSRCGADPTGLLYSATWTWAGHEWLEDSPSRAPTCSCLVASDPALGSIVALSKKHLWRWDGHTWVEGGAEPVPEDGAAVYDPALSAVVTFGTSLDRHPVSVTWTFAHDRWRRLQLRSRG